MRKLDIKLKEFLLKQEDKKVLKRTRHKCWRKQENRKNEGLSKKRISYLKKVDDSVLFVPPRVFSLRDNTEPVLKFISELKSYKNIKKDIFINLSRVEKITNGSIAMLLSIIQELSSKGIILRGRKPKAKIPKKIIEKSGFFNYVIGAIDEENIQSLDTIITKGMDVVDQESTAEIVLQSMVTVSGENLRNQPIQGMLIELMANSVNHAYPETKKKKWVLSVNHDTENKKASFAFVDNGFGIIETLNLNIKQSFKKVFSGNIDLLTTAFEGRIGSRTGLNYRGKGLPSIYRKYKQNYFKEFVVITNNVFLDFEKGNSVILKNSFYGTFFYWELNQECNYYGKDT